MERRKNHLSRLISLISIVLIATVIILLIPISINWLDSPASVIGWVEAILVPHQVIVGLSVIGVFTLLYQFQIRKRTTVLICILYLIPTNIVLIEYGSIKLILIIAILSLLLTSMILFYKKWNEKKLLTYNIIILVIVLLWFMVIYSF